MSGSPQSAQALLRMLACAGAVLVAACESDSTAVPEPPAISQQPLPNNLRRDVALSRPETEGSARRRPPITVVERGSDRFIGVAPPLDAVLDPRQDGAETYTVNLADMGIEDAARVVLGEALGLNYAVAEGLQGQVSLQTSRPVGRSALLDSFQASLEFAGAALVRSGDVYTIRAYAQASPTFVSAADRRGLGRRVVVVPLSFIGTEEMLRILDPLVTQSTVLNANPERNLLLVSGPQAEIDAVVEAVNLFDIDVMAGKSVGLFHLQSASPQDVSAELERVFQSEIGGSLEGVLDFVPNERLGSILVITSRQVYLERVEQWIRQFDRDRDLLRRRAVIYQLDNRSAVELEPVLTDLLEGWPSSTGFGDEIDAADLVLDDGATTVVADDSANAMVVWATAEEHKQLGALIRRLDATPPQVLLEATIAEVQLNDDLRLGLRWFFESGNFSFAFSDLASGASTSSFPGFSFLFDDGSSILALNALSQITDVNVVSTPSILVLDNREAELRVGDQVPIVTQSAVSVEDATAPIVNSIEYRDTGVILRIRPRVSRTGRIIMDIEQEVSISTDTVSSNIESPTISQRILRTSVSVDDGETLALGGLIEDSTSLTRTQVPLLGDIPGLGLLFKDKADEQARSELLILITPRVIRDPNEAREITDEFRRRLRQPDQLVEGGAPPRHQIRRLLQ
ncbi:MAG: type II secretion system secretin GspD [Pseudomonadota bacterium]